MSKRKSKNTLRKKPKRKNNQSTSKRSKRTTTPTKASRKGRGYKHECLFPTPETHENTGKDSCTLIDLNDSYGAQELEKLGVEGNKECNMYYYLDNGVFYRCRNKNKSGTKCNKRGAFGSGKIKCSTSSVERIKQDEPQLLSELEELINRSQSRTMTSPVKNTLRENQSMPKSSSIYLPSVPKVTYSNYPSAPSNAPVIYPSAPSNVPVIFPSAPKTIPKNITNKRPMRSIIQNTNTLKKSTRNTTMKKKLNPNTIKPHIDKLTTVITRYQKLNSDLLIKKMKYQTDISKPGLTLAMRRQILSIMKKIQFNINNNQKIINNFTIQRDKLEKLIK